MISFSQMALCNTLPDFNTEEVTSVNRNKVDINSALEDMAEHLPIEDPGKGLYRVFQKDC